LFTREYLSGLHTHTHLCGMSAAGLLPPFRRLYAKARTETENWAALQSRLEVQAASAVNIFERLPALQDAANYGVLSAGEGLPQKVYFKQLRALEALLQRMQSTLNDMEGVVTTLGRLSTEGGKLGSDGKGLSATALFLRSGAHPCPSECSEGLHDIWHMHRSELALKHALLRALSSYSTSPGDLSELLACLEDEPNIDPSRVEGLIYRVMCTVPVEQ